MDKELQGDITSVAALVGIGLGVGTLLWTISRERRKLVVKVRSEWGQEYPPGTNREDPKLITVTLTNERAVPISIASIHFEGTKPDGNKPTVTSVEPFFRLEEGQDGRRRIKLLDQKSGPQKLEQSESGISQWSTEDWESIEQIYALDTLGKKWRASKEDLQRVRDDLMT